MAVTQAALFQTRMEETLLLKFQNFSGKGN